MIGDGQKLYQQPITFAEACRFIEDHHRHHKPPQGWLFGTAVNDGEKVVGVIMVGRPVARMLQDGYTAEVTRCCTDGTKTQHPCYMARHGALLQRSVTAV